MLLTIATSFTPKMFSAAMETSVMIAIRRWLYSLFAMFQPIRLNAGMSASGSVTHTAVTVRIPAKR